MSASYPATDSEAARNQRGPHVNCMAGPAPQQRLPPAWGWAGRSPADTGEPGLLALSWVSETLRQAPRSSSWGPQGTVGERHRELFAREFAGLTFSLASFLRDSPFQGSHPSIHSSLSRLKRPWFASDDAAEQTCLSSRLLTTG